MKTNEPLNFYITQDMIVEAEQSHDWNTIKDEGEKVISAGGKVVVGVTGFVKAEDFQNWIAMAEGVGK